MTRGKLKIGMAALAAATFVVAPPAQARGKKGLIESAINTYQANHTYEVPATGTIETAFSPDEGAEHLVIKVIDSAKSELRLLSYSFTSVPVVEALIRARHRGVDIKLVADYKDNVGGKDRSGSTAHAKSRAALNALADAGAEVRTISVYPIHHDKVIIANGETVEQGSFNYSDAAAHKNSENVVVNWKNAKLAEVFLEHFQRNYRQAQPYEPSY
jgi:phosphatidylserine/phosphatidylglycerophosphate/cardiolipin synthase-like enzyme